MIRRAEGGAKRRPATVPAGHRGRTAPTIRRLLVIEHSVTAPALPDRERLR